MPRKKRKRNPQLLEIDLMENPQLLEIDLSENPQLLEIDLDDNPRVIVVDPDEDLKPEVWRALRRVYPLEVAAISFAKMYPECAQAVCAPRKKKKTVNRNRGSSGPDTSDPKYKKALKLFRDFHGRDPEDDEIFEATDELAEYFGEEGDDLYFFSPGYSPAESYDSNDLIDSSKKNGSIYVHKYEYPPMTIVSWDGKFVGKMPGKHRVERRSGDDQAWFHD